MTGAANDGGKAQRQAMTRSDAQLGVIGAEHARQAARTVREAEAEHYRTACNLADARAFPRPDRDAHRRAFFERVGHDLASANDDDHRDRDDGRHDHPEGD
jgi:hypothetical protein